MEWNGMICLENVLFVYPSLRSKEMLAVLVDFIPFYSRAGARTADIPITYLHTYRSLTSSPADV